jgi:uncharacterized membrane protein
MEIQPPSRLPLTQHRVYNQVYHARKNIAAAVLVASLTFLLVYRQMSPSRPNAAPPRYKIIDLGLATGTNNESEAHGLSENGNVAGNVLDTEGNVRAFLWSNGKLTYPTAQRPSIAAGINKSGLFVGLVVPDNRTPHAVYGQDGTVRLLFAGDDKGSIATAVNDSGQMIASRQTDAGPWQAYLFQAPRRATRIPTPENHSGFATSLNSRGDAALMLFSPKNTPHLSEGRLLLGYEDLVGKAAVYQDGKVSILPSLNKEKLAVAHDINRAGDIVGTEWSENDNTPLLWRKGDHRPRSLALPKDTGIGFAFGINDSGTIVGCVAPSATPAIREAVLWQKNGSVHYLKDLVDNRNSLTFDAGVRINRRGEILISATTPSGHSHAYLLQPQ